jgi:hypothetical protein
MAKFEVLRDCFHYGEQYKAGDIIDSVTTDPPRHFEPLDSAAKKVFAEALKREDSLLNKAKQGAYQMPKAATSSQQSKQKEG